MESELRRPIAKDARRCAFTGYRPMKMPFGYDEDCPLALDFKHRLHDTIEMLILQGYKHKAVCEDKATEICQSDIVSDIDQFKTIATSGYNPRRFVSFNQARFDRMKEPETHIQMAGTFRLTLDDNGHIDTSTPDMVEKLIKVLCNKGMVDPFDNVPVEVSGASRW